MGGDAARTVGSVFSLSRILTRSAAAAGQAVIGELQGLQAGGTAAGEAAEPPAAAEEAGAAATEVPSPPEIATPAAVPAPAAAEAATQATAPLPNPAAPRQPLMLDADQRAILEAAAAAVIAVNLAGQPPQLTTATVLWDGETLRFVTVGWSRRTTMLRADPRISLLLDGPGDGRFVTVAGQARIADGRAARDAAWPLLLRQVGEGGEATAESLWQELVAADLDRAVIVVEPEKVLSGRRQA